MSDKQEEIPTQSATPDQKPRPVSVQSTKTEKAESYRISDWASI